MKRIVRIGQTAIGIAGVLGTLVCMGAMVLAVIGVAGVGTAAAMAGMSTGAQGQAASGQHPGILAFLLQAGPVILLVSIGAFALSLATKRWVAAIPALLGDVQPAAPACDVRHDGAWPARLDRRFPLGQRPPSP